jgi:hypothetical protein
LMCKSVLFGFYFFSSFFSDDVLIAGVEPKF